LFSISFSEADNLKQRYANVPKTDQDKVMREIDNLIQRNVQNLVSDIDLTFKHFSFQLEKSRYQKFDKIFLCGGSALINYLKSSLASTYNVPIEVVNPLKHIEIAEDLLSQRRNLIDSVGHQFVISFGLALRKDNKG
ncbi:MAG: pilus assembly protein PilM, partial [bacterium]